MKIKVAGDGSSCLGVLQPVTSLVSTLSLLRPQHHHHLLMKLVNPPPSGKESTKTNTRPTKSIAVPLKPKEQLSNRRVRRCRTATEILQTIHRHASLEPKNEVLSGEKLGLRGATKNGIREREAFTPIEGNESCQRGDGFMASCASDCELYTGLQLLFRDSESDKSMHAFV